MFEALGNFIGAIATALMGKNKKNTKKNQYTKIHHH